MDKTVEKIDEVAFQGVLGAYSHLATDHLFPGCVPLPKPSFDRALEAVQSGAAKAAVIPIENSTFGRVADIHLLLPDSGLFIQQEYFQPIRHMLMAPKGVKLGDIKRVLSHPQALGQCRERLKTLGLTPEAHADTAGAAADVARSSRQDTAALASSLAAKTYDLQIIEQDMQDKARNTTRFVVLSNQPAKLNDLQGPLLTSFAFEVKHVPAALFKALGGFATNGVNITKLESYIDEDSFLASAFYAEIEGNLEMTAVARAMEELDFYSKRVRFLGTFEQARSRKAI